MLMHTHGVRYTIAYPWYALCICYTVGDDTTYSSMYT